MTHKTLSKIIDEIEQLHDLADARSRRITDNGRDITECERATSAGHASAYSFCLMRLRASQRSHKSRKRGAAKKSG